MGNKLTRRRHVVDERYTRPQGLYPIRDVDQRKLRKLILDAKLAPCYPGGEEQSADLDECPICFLYYPSLNRSRCCMKGICTECFLQMKPPNSSRSTQCPFCKTPNYCVEYRGARTNEEKINEQAEEQKVIEAKIKIQQQELKAEKERAQLKQEALRTGQVSHSHECHQNSALLSSSGFQTTNPTSPDQNDNHSMSDGDPSGNVSNVQSSSSGPLESRLIYPLSGKTITRSQTLPGRHNRNDDFDLDLEDIMVMEAIWQSIHENHTQMFTGSTSVGDDSSRPGPSSDFFGSHESSTSMSTSRDLGPNNSVTGGLACAIAALAERQVLSTDSSSRHNSENQRSRTNSSECDSLSGEDVPYSNTGVSHGSTMLVVNPVDGNRGVDEEQQSCSEDHNSESGDRGAGFHTPDNWIEVSLESGRAVSPCAREGSQVSTSDWVADHSSEVVEVGTSFSSSVRSTSDIPWASEAPQSTENAMDAPSLNGPPYAIPESYEEQIMLALALSLAEAQAQS